MDTEQLLWELFGIAPRGAKATEGQLPPQFQRGPAQALGSGQYTYQPELYSGDAPPASDIMESVRRVQANPNTQREAQQMLEPVRQEFEQSVRPIQQNIRNHGEQAAYLEELMSREPIPAANPGAGDTAQQFRGRNPLTPADIARSMTPAPTSPPRARNPVIDLTTPPPVMADVSRSMPTPQATASAPPPTYPFTIPNRPVTPPPAETPPPAPPAYPFPFQPPSVYDPSRVPPERQAILDAVERQRQQQTAQAPAIYPFVRPSAQPGNRTRLEGGPIIRADGVTPQALTDLSRPQLDLSRFAGPPQIVRNPNRHPPGSQPEVPTPTERLNIAERNRILAMSPPAPPSRPPTAPSAPTTPPLASAPAAPPIQVPASVAPQVPPPPPKTGEQIPQSLKEQLLAEALRLTAERRQTSNQVGLGTR